MIPNANYDSLIERLVAIKGAIDIPLAFMMSHQSEAIRGQYKIIENITERLVYETQTLTSLDVLFFNNTKTDLGLVRFCIDWKKHDNEISTMGRYIDLPSWLVGEDGKLVNDQDAQRAFLEAVGPDLRVIRDKMPDLSSFGDWANATTIIHWEPRDEAMRVAITEELNLQPLGEDTRRDWERSRSPEPPLATGQFIFDANTTPRLLRELQVFLRIYYPI